MATRSATRSSRPFSATIDDLNAPPLAIPALCRDSGSTERVARSLWSTTITAMDGSASNLRNLGRLSLTPDPPPSPPDRLDSL